MAEPEPRACTKYRHRTLEGAERHKARLEELDRRNGITKPARINVYLCPICPDVCYHVGHRGRRKKGSRP